MLDPRTPDLTFMLPGNWWHLPLGDADSAPDNLDSRVRAMLHHVVGHADKYATLRRELRLKVLEAAKTALGAGASDFYFALEIVPGVPIPVSLSVYSPAIPVGLSLEGSALAAAESLKATLTRVDDAQTMLSWGDREMAVLRGHKVIRGNELSVAGVAESGELIVSYWLLTRGDSRIPLLSFASPLHALEEELLVLFDAIVSTAAARSEPSASH